MESKIAKVATICKPLQSGVFYSLLLKPPLLLLPPPNKVGVFLKRLHVSRISKHM